MGIEEAEQKELEEMRQSMPERQSEPNHAQNAEKAKYAVVGDTNPDGTADIMDNVTGEVIGKDTSAFDKLAEVDAVFRRVFGDSVHIMTKEIKPGGTSSNIYVPKGYENCLATLIIWDKNKLSMEGSK